MNFIESAPYAVVDLARLWNISPEDVIRMAYAESIPVKGLLRDVMIVTTVNNRKTKGLPPPEEFFKDVQSDVKMLKQWPIDLHIYHLNQMLIDGYADVSNFQKENKTTDIKSEGEAAKVTTDDCSILGEHAKLLVEKYNILLKDGHNETKAKQQTHKQTKAPQERKKVNNLLKVIGGFVEVFYLHKEGTLYGSSGNPNITAIADSFHGSLAGADFSDDGIKSRSLRDTFSASLEQIQHNKII